MRYNVWASDEYKKIRDACNVLHEIIHDGKVEVAERVSAVRVLLECIAFRREMRGIPRLASHKVKELVPRAPRSRPQVTDITEAIDVTPKESLEKPEGDHRAMIDAP